MTAAAPFLVQTITDSYGTYEERWMGAATRQRRHIPHHRRIVVAVRRLLGACHPRMDGRRMTVTIVFEKPADPLLQNDRSAP